MPNFAAIVVKKADTVTDITYNPQFTAQAKGVWAEWRQDTANTFPPAGRPVFKHRVTETGRGVRRVEVEFLYPYVYTDTTTSQPVISPLSCSFKNGAWNCPQALPSTVLAEAAAQLVNLLQSPTLRTGFADQTAFG